MVDKDPNSIDMDQVVGNSAVAAVEKLKRDAAFCKMVLGEGLLCFLIIGSLNTHTPT